MKISDLFYISFQNFKNRKSRIALTVLGIAVAISAVLFLVSFGYGLQNILLEKITTKDSLLALDITSSDPEIVKIDDNSVKRIKMMPSVEKVSLQAVFPGQVSLDEFNSETTINIIDDNFFSLEGVSPLEGKFFSDSDVKKVVVNNSIGRMFDLEGEAIIGKELSFTVFSYDEDGMILPHLINGPFEVIGVIEGGGSGEVWLNKKDVLSLPISDYQFAKVKVTDDKEMEDIRERLIGMGFLVSSLSDTIEQANKIFSVVQFILGIFGIIALVVAAIGLVNTMTIALLERTNEIGIMKAIGASKKDILFLFLSESLIVGVFGGIFGILLGIMEGEIFNFIVNIIAVKLGGQIINLFVYPLWFIVFVITLSTFVGLIGGFFPAKRASNLNPLKALRYK
jgi:putative ABC transport system permease protein